MAKITIAASYHTGAESTIELPDGKVWGDVEDWYVKWDTLHFKFKGEDDWREKSLNSCSTDSTDWKRPINVAIYPVTDGYADYNTELAGS